MQELLNYEIVLNSTPSKATEIIIQKEATTKIALFTGILVCLLLAVII